MVRMDAVATRPSPAWIEVTINCVDVEVVAGFWCRLLGLDRAEDPLPGWARTSPTIPGGPVLTFQPVLDPTPGRSRVHLDLRADDLGAAVALVLALGGPPGSALPGSAQVVHAPRTGLPTVHSGSAILGE